MVKNEIQEMSNFAFLFCKAYGFFMSLGKKQHFVYNFPKDTFKNMSLIQAQAAVEEFHALVDEPWERAVNRAYFS